MSASVGIIGCGTITSGTHLPILMNMRDVKVTYLADLEAPKELAADFGTRAVGTDDISSLPECDIIFLATPVGVREAYIEEFGLRGTLVFTEKPFAIDGSQHRRFLKMARNASCNYMKTTFGTIHQVKSLVNTGLFGALRRVLVTEGGVVGATGKTPDSYQNSAALSGGGILMERGCHTLSQLTHVLEGYDFDIVDADISWLDDLDIDVRAQLTAVGKNAVEISYQISMIRPLPSQMTLEFDNAHVSFDHSDPTCELSVRDVHGHTKLYLQRDPSRASMMIQAFFLRWMSVLDAWRGQVPMDSAVATSLATTRIIDAIYRAGGRTT